MGIPVTTIGGYLGAGKTTLVNHLLRNAQGLRLAVLVNEFGDLAIDADLIEAQSEDIISIAGGCVCCSFGNDLIAALLDMAKMVPPPDHILIEASGVAIPGSIGAAVDLLDGFSADGIVILADAETIQQQAGDTYMGDTVMRQLHDADIILLNKTDLISPLTLAETRQWLYDLVPQARIVDSAQAKVPPEIVLESFLGRGHVDGPHHDVANLHIQILRPDISADIDAMARGLAEDSGIIRAKGFATSRDGTNILVQVVGARWQTSPVSGYFENGIVCLGLRGRMNLPD